MTLNNQITNEVLGDLEVVDFEMFVVLNQARMSVFEQFHFDFADHSILPMYVKEDRTVHLFLDARFTPFVMVNSTGEKGMSVWCNYKIELTNSTPDGKSWIEISLIDADEVLRLDEELQARPDAVELHRMQNYKSCLAQNSRLKQGCGSKKSARKSQVAARRKNRK